LNFDPFDLVDASEVPPDIAEALSWSQAERGPFGSPLFYAVETGSTNDVAARLADAGASTGTTVVVESQTAGRGRHHRQWCSPPGAGLYVSTIVRPSSAPTTASGTGASLVTLMAGVALAEAIDEATGLRVAIKWPNDLVVARRKLAGILAEAAAVGHAFEYIVVGFGINLRPAVYPPDVAARATSIEAELGRRVDRGALLARAMVNLFRGWTALSEGRTAEVTTRWRERAPSAVGSLVEWQAGARVRRGVTAGIDGDGALLIEVDGTVERVIAGEIVWV